MADSPLPLEFTSALVRARDQVVAAVETWGREYWGAATIGHAGKVTMKFLREQSGMAPRSIVTVLSGNNAALSRGKSTQFAFTFQWFIVAGGVLTDRTDLGLNLSGEGIRLVNRAPWSNLADSAFSKDPESGSVAMASIYDDDDERMALSIWGIQWRQAIDLGAAGRPPIDAAEPLATITGNVDVGGSPNDETVSVEVP